MREYELFQILQHVVGESEHVMQERDDDLVVRYPEQGLADFAVLAQRVVVMSKRQGQILDIIAEGFLGMRLAHNAREAASCRFEAENNFQPFVVPAGEPTNIFGARLEVYEGQPIDLVGYVAEKAFFGLFKIF